MLKTLRQPTRRSTFLADRLRPIVDDRLAEPAITTAQMRERLPQYLPRMLAVARRHLECEADCADAVQDACVRALSALPRFRGECDLGTWLHRIVVNVCLMQKRSRAVRRTSTITGAEGIAAEVYDEPLWSDDALCRVRELISRLPAAQQLVIQLRYFERFNTAETAAVLGVRPEVVKTRLHRARRALRRLICCSIASEA